MVAQCMGFLLAGFETVQLTLSCMAWDLAQNQKSQEKLIQEVLSVLKESGQLDYDTVQKMPYLECAIKGKHHYNSK